MSRRTEAGRAGGRDSHDEGTQRGRSLQKHARRVFDEGGYGAETVFRRRREREQDRKDVCGIWESTDTYTPQLHIRKVKGQELAIVDLQMDVGRPKSLFNALQWRIHISYCVLKRVFIGMCSFMRTTKIMRLSVQSTKNEKNLTGISLRLSRLPYH